MEKISLKERFSYGLGDLACNLMFQLITAYLMFFYTDVAGIGLGAISLIMLVARVVDAVTDPMMGVVIDKTHTKWGKARPYVLWNHQRFHVPGAEFRRNGQIYLRADHLYSVLYRVYSPQYSIQHHAVLHDG